MIQQISPGTVGSFHEAARENDATQNELKPELQQSQRPRRSVWSAVEALVDAWSDEAAASLIVFAGRAA